MRQFTKEISKVKNVQKADDRIAVLEKELAEAKGLVRMLKVDRNAFLLKAVEHKAEIAEKALHLSVEYARTLKVPFATVIYGTKHYLKEAELLLRK